jgi:hypothetical protein
MRNEQGLNIVLADNDDEAASKKPILFNLCLRNILK